MANKIYKIEIDTNNQREEERRVEEGLLRVKEQKIYGDTNHSYFDIRGHSVLVWHLGWDFHTQIVAPRKADVDSTREKFERKTKLKLTEL